MSKYLELVPKLNTITLAKSFTFPYIAVEDTEEQACQYTPKTDGIEILTHKSRNERRIEGPCILEFYLPSFYWSNGDSWGIHLSFTPDADESDAIPTVFNQDIITIGTATWTQPFSKVIQNDKEIWTLNGFQIEFWDQKPFLQKFYIELFEPGILNITISDLLNNTINYPSLQKDIPLLISDSRKFILPKFDLKTNSSCYFTWVGSAPATLYIGTWLCEDFEPNIESTYVSAAYELASGEYVQMIDVINEWGTWFKDAKLVSEQPGSLLAVDRRPPMGGAKVLKYQQPISLTANEEYIFCFPKLWKSTSFVTTSNATMYISNTPDFITSSDDPNVLATYSVYEDIFGSSFSLSALDISTLAVSAQDDYLYVKFQCMEDTIITPVEWNPSSDIQQSLLLCSGRQITVPRLSKDVLYRLRYADWKDYDMTINWTNRSRPVPVYFASVCDFTLSSTAPNVVYYKSCRMGATTITAEEVNAWATNVDEEGFLYVRMNPQGAGKATFTTTKPAEEDPEISTNE